MRIWQATTSDVEGCIRLVNPSVLKPKNCVLTSSDIPVLMLRATQYAAMTDGVALPAELDDVHTPPPAIEDERPGADNLPLVLGSDSDRDDSRPKGPAIQAIRDGGLFLHQVHRRLPLNVYRLPHLRNRQVSTFVVARQTTICRFQSHPTVVQVMCLVNEDRIRQWR